MRGENEWIRICQRGTFRPKLSETTFVVLGGLRREKGGCDGLNAGLFSKTMQRGQPPSPFFIFTTQTLSPHPPLSLILTASDFAKFHSNVGGEGEGEKKERKKESY